ncbi:MAG: DNA polymerase III subunit delta [Burkholderiales bacterium]|nr:DNA polymerase III subunit delta [Burkholderiales bacterium]
MAAALSPEDLPARLARGLAPLYTVTGDEPLRALEAADAIRTAAKKAGFSDRKLYSTHQHFDWAAPRADLAGMSLFGDRPLIDLRIPNGKPGRDGALVLEKLAEAAHPDALLLITFPGDWSTLKTAWCRKLMETGVFVESRSIEPKHLPEWIALRLKRQGQSADDATLRLIAGKVEGNLLAAHQELQKLELLYPAGPLSWEQVQDAVLDVARYDLFKLSEAWLAGDCVRLRRMVEGLKGEGEPPPLVLWAMADDIRTLAKLKRGERVFNKGPRLPAYEKRARSIEPRSIGDALKHAAAIDRLIKGLRPREISGDVWEEFYRLGARLAA